MQGKTRAEDYPASWSHHTAVFISVYTVALPRVVLTMIELPHPVITASALRCSTLIVLKIINIHRVVHTFKIYTLN